MPSNFGSNTLIIESRGLDDDKYEIILGDGAGIESLIWFFETLAEALSALMQISLQAVDSCNQHAKYFQDLTDFVDNR